MNALVRWLLREPLILFMALGGCIFALNAIIHPAPTNDARRIEVTSADSKRIRALYTQQWGAPPSEADMPSLLDNFVSSEVLFREGTALGLGSDDPVIRNRIIQKMNFLLQDASTISQPSEAEMLDYLQSHQASYRFAEQVIFSQIYFSPALRGKRMATDAGVVLEHLKWTKPGGVDRGDPFMQAGDMSPQSHQTLAKEFGPAFADALFALPEGSWQGPVPSVFGVHVVRILDRKPSRMPTLAEVRDRVHDDLMAERLHVATNAAYEKILSKYWVVIAGAPKPTGQVIARNVSR
jgi:hypothetical protein